MFWCRHFIFLKGMHFSSNCIIATSWPYGRSFISNSPSKPTAFELEWVVDEAFILDFKSTLHTVCWSAVQFETQSEWGGPQRHQMFLFMRSRATLVFYTWAQMVKTHAKGEEYFVLCPTLSIPYLYKIYIYILICWLKISKKQILDIHCILWIL